MVHIYPPHKPPFQVGSHVTTIEVPHSCDATLLMDDSTRFSFTGCDIYSEHTSSVVQGIIDERLRINSGKDHVARSDQQSRS